MSKKFSKLFIFLLMLFFIPTFIVHAETQVAVNDQEELLNALNNTNVTTIILNKDIDTTQKINITRNITLDGNGHTMKYVGSFSEDGSKDNTKWGGIYVIQIYKTKVTVKDIKLTGGNAAILVNGGELNISGTVDVSGNGFGGIELSQGKNVSDTSKLTINGKIVNSTDSKDTPTLWVPSDSKDAIVVMNGIEEIIEKGKELTISEINELFDLGNDNPQTKDSMNIYLALSLISLIGLTTISIKNMKKEY